mgnify:CR=1 FL=1
MLTPAEYTAKKKREQARERQRRFRERHPEKAVKNRKIVTDSNQNKAEDQ